MRFHAVIFDVYGTLLEIRPPPSTAAADWARLYLETFHRDPPFERSTFAGACAERISQQHELARSRGIAHPEIVWPSIVGEVLPEFTTLSSAAQEEFILRQVRLSHTASLNRHVPALLPPLRAAGRLVGLASNAQAYTVQELQAALAGLALPLTGLFEPCLCFWSYQYGFSKPDPHVFQILSSRLRGLGVEAEEILMVGDRLDNDIEPALRHGWKAWWLTEEPGKYPGGGWPALCRALGFPGE